MASLFGKLAGFARSPQGQKMMAQAARKAQEMANDPATRAKVDQGTARVRAEVAKRRGPSAAAGAPPAGAPPVDTPPVDTGSPTSPDAPAA